MLIVLRNCLFYIFYGIGDIYCIGVYLYVCVDVFWGLKFCIYCDVLKVILCFRCYLICFLNFYVFNNNLMNIEEKN